MKAEDFASECLHSWFIGGTKDLHEAMAFALKAYGNSKLEEAAKVCSDWATNVRTAPERRFCAQALAVERRADEILNLKEPD
jgi:hypothetical protein